MKHLGTIMIAAMAGAFAVATLTPSGFAQDIAAAVKARQDLMKSNGAQLQRINQATDAAAIQAAARTLQANAAKLSDASLWPAKSNTPTSRAKPEIWQSMSDFQAKAGAFKAAADQLAAAAQKGDVQAAKGAVKGVGGTCGACHQAYRGPEIGKK